jgi:hypothetical protein
VILVIPDEGAHRIIEIPPQNTNFHFVQPMPDGNLLLAGARCHFRGAEDFDRNGRLFSPRGSAISENLLGDGIQDVQVDAEGAIWTSYFDEGIFGNSGWENPIGAAGLVAWDASGRKLYEFEPESNLDSMCDCYALNVDFTGSVWCCYYTEFPLVRLRGRKIAAVWHPCVSGSGAFAVAGDFALFCGGYEHPDEYSLVRLLGRGETKKVGTYTFTDPEGGAIRAGSVAARGDLIVGLWRSRIFRIRIQDVISRDPG